MRNTSQSLRHLTTCFPVGVLFGGGVGGVAPMEEVCHRGQALRLKSLVYFYFAPSVLGLEERS